MKTRIVVGLNQIEYIFQDITGIADNEELKQIKEVFNEKIRVLDKKIDNPG